MIANIDTGRLFHSHSRHSDKYENYFTGFIINLEYHMLKKNIETIAWPDIPHVLMVVLLTAARCLNEALHAITRTRWRRVQTLDRHHQ